MGIGNYLFGPSASEQLDMLSLQKLKEEQAQLLRAKQSAGRLLDFDMNSTAPQDAQTPEQVMSRYAAGMQNPGGGNLTFDPREYGQQRDMLQVGMMGGPLAYYQAKQAADAENAKIDKYGPGDIGVRRGTGEIVTSAPFKPDAPHIPEGMGPDGKPLPGYLEFQRQLADAKRDPNTAPKVPETKAVFDNMLGKNRMATTAEIASDPMRFTEAAPQKPYGYDDAQAAKTEDRARKEAADEAAFKTADYGFERLSKDATDLASSPGLSKITGKFAGLGAAKLVDQDAINAQASIDNLVSQTAMQTLQAARTGSTNGATGFGALSEKELALVENAVTNLRNQRQDTDTYKKNLQTIIDYSNRLRTTLKDSRQKALGGGVAQSAPAAAEPSLQQWTRDPKTGKPVRLGS